ncbi:MAG: hypothetical protein HQL23_01740 [Candidatus Omnitrophica bacterium]|nr:hypothetical protein [Candidatus Omnitrophota bacterium]
MRETPALRHKNSSRTNRHPIASEKGMIFVLVIVILMVMIALALTILSLNISQTLIAENEIKRVQAEMISLGALNWTLANHPAGVDGAFDCLPPPGTIMVGTAQYKAVCVLTNGTLTITVCQWSAGVCI